MSTVQIISLVVSVYLGGMATTLSTQNIASAVFFKFISLIGAFALGLITFGVIQ